MIIIMALIIQSTLEASLEISLIDAAIQQAHEIVVSTHINCLFVCSLITSLQLPPPLILIANAL